MNIAGEEILPLDHRRVTEPAKSTYSQLGKPFEKRRKTIEDPRIKQVEALKPEESLKALKLEEN